LPYLREGELGDRLGQILNDIRVPDGILAQLTNSLLTDKKQEEIIRKRKEEKLRQSLASVRQRLDAAYVDKVDGEITEEFWERKSKEWQAEEQQLQLAIGALEQVQPERMVDAVKILELANKAHFLYVEQPPAERAKLLRMVLSNCAIDATSLYPTYRKPFDLIFAQVQDGEWRARRDSNPRPSA
jgi:site-specific DNA recombinase